MIVNLVSMKGENNANSSPQLTFLHHYLVMSIVDTPEKDLSNNDRKYDMMKLHISSVKWLLPLFLCSIHAMYNIEDFDPKNVSCWNHAFQGIVHWLIKREIITILHLKI